jgi:hypothetical protein
VGIRQRIEKHTIDDRKECGIRSNAEREGSDNNYRETRRLDEHAESVADVVMDVLEQRIHGFTSNPMICLGNSAVKSLSFGGRRVFHPLGRAGIGFQLAASL